MTSPPGGLLRAGVDEDPEAAGGGRLPAWGTAKVTGLAQIMGQLARLGPTV
jgi:hypothetical protein